MSLGAAGHGFPGCSLCNVSCFTVRGWKEEVEAGTDKCTTPGLVTSDVYFTGRGKILQQKRISLTEWGHKTRIWDAKNYNEGSVSCKPLQFKKKQEMRLLGSSDFNDLWYKQRSCICVMVQRNTYMQVFPTVGRVCSHSLAFCPDPIGNIFNFNFSDLAASAHFQGRCHSAVSATFHHRILFPAGGTWLVIDRMGRKGFEMKLIHSVSLHSFLHKF